MTALEITILILSLISTIGAVITWFIARIKVSTKREEKKLLADAFGFGSIVKSAQSSMKQELSQKQKEVITRLVWRSSGVPLVGVLNKPQERLYILQGLADPSRYPWEEETPDNTG